MLVGRAIEPTDSRILGGLSDIDRVSTINQGMGIEGACATAYFSAIFSALPADMAADVRSRRPPRDPANALLSLSYTLAHHECVCAAYAVGLDPYVGFLHSLDYGRESMACDLVEPLRTLLDAFVLDLLQARTLRREHFHVDQQPY
ncbi:CRISPR-associated endonuclease Cas1 [Acidithiobacillus sp. MC6.1]|nr:CRISPR-associated endonuclease Cas1 [Acidithiobacillus sp. MC6.1]